MQKNIIFSGMQPTGTLHLGNYLGALKQWVELQAKYECIFFVADYHSITIPYNAKELPKKIIELVLDYLAAGINPAKSLLFVQSHVPEHTELAWIFSTLTSLGELERMTQFKEKATRHKQAVNAGLFTYPILQAADILLYKANLVPVGEDQIQHVELTRDIARKFNNTFAKIFPEPKPLLTRASRIMSLLEPESKMSKSHGEKNYIALTDSPTVIKQKISKAVTATTGGSQAPGVKNLFNILAELGDEAQVSEMRLADRAGTLKYATLKEKVAAAIINHLKPIQARRRELEHDKNKIASILVAGAERARAIAQKTMAEVRDKIGIR